ncbi:TlpA disulfide reductase family protein [Alkalihalobacillus sp. LMS39]|uniref:TlpA disulfide reductase family protein n=1 Tax=Alkalihalobacillus sp. LMS39 TaxID=2924032 RepID=UPI001FB2CB43|nr:TlpA disulfide reductase family protein [Alkalihalobacillus sp. LMS39]UOE96116.1 TlpA family protein disulfide reductase [Alkalihalobacillus sp. LMS39]
MNTRKLVSGIVLIIAFLFIGYSVYTNVISDKVGTDKGNVAPDFTAERWPAELGPGALSDYKGNIVVLNFWASWCEPCRDEMPELMAFQDDFQDAGIEVVGVNMTRTERRKVDGEEFLEEMNITFPSFFDYEGEIFKAYQPQFFPTTYILNEDLLIEAVIRGELDYEMLEHVVTPLLSE